MNSSLDSVVPLIALVTFSTTRVRKVSFGIIFHAGFIHPPSALLQIIVSLRHALMYLLGLPSMKLKFLFSYCRYGTVRLHLSLCQGAIGFEQLEFFCGCNNGLSSWSVNKEKKIFSTGLSSIFDRRVSIHLEKVLALARHGPTLWMHVESPAETCPFAFSILNISPLAYENALVASRLEATV